MQANAIGLKHADRWFVGSFAIFKFDLLGLLIEWIFAGVYGTRLCVLVLFYFFLLWFGCCYWTHWDTIEIYFLFLQSFSSSSSSFCYYHELILLSSLVLTITSTALTSSRFVFLSLVFLFPSSDCNLFYYRSVWSPVPRSHDARWNSLFRKRQKKNDTQREREKKSTSSVCTQFFFRISFLFIIYLSFSNLFQTKHTVADIDDDDLKKKT